VFVHTLTQRSGFSVARIHGGVPLLIVCQRKHFCIIWPMSGSVSIKAKKKLI